MTVTEYLREKGILGKDATKWVVKFDDGKEYDIVELMEDYTKNGVFEPSPPPPDPFIEWEFSEEEALIFDFHGAPSVHGYYLRREHNNIIIKTVKDLITENIDKEQNIHITHLREFKSKKDEDN